MHLIGGAATTVTQGRGALQDVEQLAVFKPVTKWSVSIRSTGDIQPVLQQALPVARSGTPGPVFVEIPIDLLYPFRDVKKEYFGGAEPRTLQQKLVRQYLSYCLGLCFAGGAKTPFLVHHRAFVLSLCRNHTHLPTQALDTHETS